MRILHEQYEDNIPTTFEELLKLPGVGRKSANLIMGDVFGKPAIVTDTHCIRLTNRIGLVDNIKEPKKVEMAYGRSFLRRRAVIFVTDLFIMEETCVLPGRNPIVINAVWKISARKISDTEGEKEYGIEGSTSYCVACI